MTLASLGLRLCASFETYCKVQIKDLPADVEGERKGEGEGEQQLRWDEGEREGMKVGDNGE